MSGILIVIIWAIAGVLAIGEGLSNSKEKRVLLINYLLCWGILMFQLFCDYILKV